MRSAARPAGNNSAAKTMAYTSRIHETSDSAAGAKSRCSAGSAMLTTHRSSVTRNWAADTTASTANRRRPVPGSSAGGGASLYPESSGMITSLRPAAGFSCGAVPLSAGAVISSPSGALFEIRCTAEGMNCCVRAALVRMRSCHAAGRTPGTLRRTPCRSRSPWQRRASPMPP